MKHDCCARFHRFVILSLLLLAGIGSPALVTGQSTIDYTWQPVNPYRATLSLNGTWALVNPTGSVAGQVEVPGVLQQPQMRTLSRAFFLPAELRNKSIHLHAQAINHSCTILINNAFLASHASGYSSFDVELKPANLHFGADNLVTIEVENNLTATSTLPLKHRPFGWASRAGVLRDIYLEARPAVAIDDLGVRSQFADGYTTVNLTIDLTLTTYSDVTDSISGARGYSVYVEMIDPETGIQVATSLPATFAQDHSNIVQRQVTLAAQNIVPWHPDRPKLYRLVAHLLADGQEIDQLAVPAGFRELRFQNRRIMLNGEPFTIRGVNWFDELHGLSGAALDEKISRVLQQLKALGANAVRIYGHPAHPRFVARCSEEGIFVLEEIPLYYATAAQLTSDVLTSQARSMLDELIKRDRMQPAVLGWGLGVNLEDTKPEVVQKVALLTSQAKKLDDRPVYVVTRTKGESVIARAVDFILIDNFGDVGLGYELHWFPEKPVLPVIGFFSEAMHVSGNLVDPERRLIEAEEIQAQRLEQILKSLTNDWPDYTGSFVHALKDWQSDLPLLLSGGAGDPLTYPAGLIRRDDSHKIGFRMVAAFNRNERKPPISPSVVSSKPPIVFPIVGILALLVLLFNANRDKKMRAQLQRAFAHPHGFYMDLLDNRKVQAYHSTLLGLLQGVIWAVLITSFFYAFKESLLLDEVLSLLIPQPVIKSYVIWLIWHPNWMIALLTLLYFIGMVALAIFFRLIGFVFRTPVSLQQFYTFVFWAAICYLPLVLLAPVFYRVLTQHDFLRLVLIVLAAFLLWHLVRMNRGLRVLYIQPPARATLIFLCIIALVVFSALFYFNQSVGLLNYYQYYVGLLPL